MTPKLIELVEISHAPANFFNFVNQCNLSIDLYFLGNLYNKKTVEDFAEDRGLPFNSEGRHSLLSILC